jgi:High potential iron-sulfur protein
MRSAHSTPATRRMLLLAALAAPAAAFAVPAAAAGEACVDLDALPSGQRSMREALNFKLVSDDPGKRCSGCAFYTATAADCGKCRIFNGSTPAQGRCDSWAARK